MTAVIDRKINKGGHGADRGSPASLVGNSGNPVAGGRDRLPRRWDYAPVYTWNQAAAENITTPDDAIFPEVPVRGPLSMYAQSDIITHHQLDSTGGLRYAAMPRVRSPRSTRPATRSSTTPVSR